MSVVIQQSKKKPSTKKVPSFAPITTPAMTMVAVKTMEYIQLYSELQSFDVEGKQKRMNELKKELLAESAIYNHNHAVVFDCPTGEIEFSKVPEVREVADPLAAIKLVESKHGLAAAQSIANVTMTALGKVLSENEIMPLVTIHSGTRRLCEVRPKVEAE